jgi:hypothetical protein
LGTTEGLVNAKLPVGLAVPPVSVLAANVCPYVIALAVGAALIVGTALAIVNKNGEELAPS